MILKQIKPISQHANPTALTIIGDKSLQKLAKTASNKGTAMTVI